MWPAGSLPNNMRTAKSNIMMACLLKIFLQNFSIYTYMGFNSGRSNNHDQLNDQGVF